MNSMEQKLDFSLPEGRPKGGFWTRTMAMLLLVAILVGLGNLVMGMWSPKARPDRPSSETSLSAEQLKELANKLSQRNLYEQAAKVWQEYLDQASIPPAERAKVLFQVAACLEKAGRYAEAVEFLYRCEMTARVDDLASQISSHMKDCLERMGRFSALRYEVMARTSYKAQEDSAAKVVAEVGPEKITEADLAAAIEGAVDMQLAPVAAFMTAEQLQQQKQQLLGEYKTAGSRQKFLQTWLAQEMLYRQALEDGLAQQAQTKKVLDDVTRSVLAQQLMNSVLASRIHITDGDLQTFYNASKDRFVEPAKARIRHVLVADEAKAKEVLQGLQQGQDFGAVAKEQSQDQDTRDKGGTLDADVTERDPIPGIGSLAELSTAIFQAKAPALLDRPFKTDKGWEVVKVESLQPSRQRPFDEVRQEVLETLANQKRQEVQQDTLKQMMDKYQVVIHTSAFGDPKPEDKTRP